MSVLTITNKTLIEKNAFHLIGACTKRDDNSKIGYFGSGLKYAIAILLREKIPFKVYSGNDEIKIETKPETFRGQTFNVIYIDGMKTSLTTDMGPSWKVWQAIREIFCNAIDEGNCKYSIEKEIIKNHDTTGFHIDCDNGDMAEIINMWDKYFAHKRLPLASCKTGNVYPRMGEYVNIYRKGIRCYEQSTKALYDYNINEIEINESRIIEHEGSMKKAISDIWKQSATNEMLDMLCNRTANKDTLESYSVWYWCDNYQLPFGEQWYNYFEHKNLIPANKAGWFIDDLAKPNSVVLPDELIGRLKEQFPDLKYADRDYNEKYKYKTIALSEAEKFKLKKALQFFEEVKLKIDYPVHIAEFEDKGVFGRAHDGKVVVSRRRFDMGIRAVALTILEEIAHLESEKADETREFEHYLLNQILTLLENQNGIFL